MFSIMAQLVNGRRGARTHPQVLLKSQPGQSAFLLQSSLGLAIFVFECYPQVDTVPPPPHHSSPCFSCLLLSYSHTLTQVAEMIYKFRCFARKQLPNLELPYGLFPKSGPNEIPRMECQSCFPPPLHKCSSFTLQNKGKLLALGITSWGRPSWEETSQR